MDKAVSDASLPEIVNSPVAGAIASVPTLGMNSEEDRDGHPKLKTNADVALSTDEHIARLKAEIEKLQLIVRRMSTVDASAVRSNTGKVSCVSTIHENGHSSDGGLFDSDDEAGADKMHQMSEENFQLKLENENLRVEVESLKELCEACRTGICSLSAEEIRQIEEQAIIRLLSDVRNYDNGVEAMPLLLIKQNEKIDSLTTALLLKDEALESAKRQIEDVMRHSGQIQSAIRCNLTPPGAGGRWRQSIDEALAADAIVNGPTNGSH